jgi:enoyl-CoA hydratase
MAFRNISLDLRDRVAIVTINRPDKLNALNHDTLAELDAAIEQVRTSDDIAGAIITGAGAKAFVAGADIGELATQSPLEARQRALRGQRIFGRIESSPRPVIAAVNGFALGGGCELALACHIRIASDNAKLGLPELKLGICPGYGGTQRLPRLVGKGRALQMMLTGDMVDAHEAYRIGLVNAVVPAAELITAAEQMLRKMMAVGPLSVALTIEAVNHGLEMSLEEGLALEANHFGLLAASEDSREGTRAFLEKREAKFQGR